MDNILDIYVSSKPFYCTFDSRFDYLRELFEAYIFESHVPPSARFRFQIHQQDKVLSLATKASKSRTTTANPNYESG